jgi:chaperonin GroEL (HSP60 family)
MHAMRAVLQIKNSNASYADREMIKIQPQKGRTVGETELVKGVVLKNDRLSRATPEKVWTQRSLS